VRRVLCWLVWLLTFSLLGHRWVVLRTNTSKHLSLMHLHPLAGVDAMCLRCGTRWDDAELPQVVTLPPPPGDQLPHDLEPRPGSGDFVQIQPEPRGGWLQTRPEREEF